MIKIKNVCSIGRSETKETKNIWVKGEFYKGHLSFADHKFKVTMYGTFFSFKAVKIIYLFFIKIKCT